MNETSKSVRGVRVYWLFALSVLLVNCAGSAYAARPTDDRPVDTRAKQGPTIKHGATTQRSTFTPLATQPPADKPLPKGTKDWKKQQK